jgi:hypothetical protein
VPGILSLLGAKQRGMGFFGAFQRRRGRRRIQQEFDKAALVFGGKADDLGLLDGTVRGLLGGGDRKVADAAALHFGGLFHQAKHIGGNASRQIAMF